jgi:hypothetical protein
MYRMQFQVNVCTVLDLLCTDDITYSYCHVYGCDCRRCFGLNIGFIDRLQVLTTNNYNTIAISTLYNSLEPTLSLFQSPVFSLVVVW